jgi:hypothetical protein
MFAALSVENPRTIEEILPAIDSGQDINEQIDRTVAPALAGIDG